MALKTGVVKTAFADKGYGFISSEGSPDTFFHSNQVEGKQMLEVGDVVRFEIGTSRGKPCAKNVRVEGVSGNEKEWFAAVENQDTAKLKLMAASGHDVNGICRDKFPCRRCNGSGEGQGGYSGEDIQVSRRCWICGGCEGHRFIRPMQTAVALAVHNDKLESLKALVSLRADVNKQCPLLAATASGKDRTVETLLAARANPNIRHCAVVDDQRAALFVAAERGHELIVEMLLEAGAEPDVYGMLDHFDDYCDEVEFVSAQQIAHARGHSEIARSISDWKQQKPFAVHILSHVADCVELSIVGLGGNEIRLNASSQETPSNIWEKMVAHQGADEGKIRLVLPDGSCYSRRTVEAFAGTLDEFLGLTPLSA